MGDNRGIYVKVGDNADIYSHLFKMKIVSPFDPYSLPLSDFNECESSSTHDCEGDDLCVNKEGTYICTCSTGYYLLPDGRTCKGRS